MASSQSAAKPALLMALIAWILSGLRNFTHKIANIDLLAVVDGVFVALAAYLLIDSQLSSLLLHAHPVDMQIFDLLFVGFSINLGLSNIASVGLIYNKYLSVRKPMV